MTLDYIAGLFDGEGSASITCGKAPRTTRGKQYQVRIDITLKQFEVLESIQQIFQGTIKIDSLETENHCAYYRWRIFGKNAQIFAMALAEKTYIKRQHLLLVNEFQSFKSENKNKPTSDSRWAGLTEFFNRMQGLNHRGPKR